MLSNDIDALRTLVARSSRRLNRLRCPLLRLPPEIVRLIIDLVVDWVVREHGRTKMWMALGHVCHDLRLNLLSMPVLWGSQAFAWDVIANERFLERAHGTPIKIFLSYYSRESLWELAARHVHQAQAIEATGRASIGTIIHELHRNLPLIESMHLMTSFDGSSVILLPQTFSAPNLRHLRLSDISMDFRVLRFTNLTTLGLHISYRHSTPPSTTHFFDFLRSCVNLRVLALRGCIPSWAEGDEEEQLNPISLPWLSALGLAQDRTSIIRFWRMINIPPSTSITISFDDARMELDANSFMTQVEDTRVFLNHVLAVDNRALPPVSALKITAGEDEDEDAFWFRFRLYRAECGIGAACSLDKSPSKWSCVSSFEMTLDEWTGRELANAVACFASIFKLSQISLLSLDGDDINGYLQVHGLDPLYVPFRAVQTLHLGHCRDPEAFMLLGGFPHAANPSPPPCPALQNLYLSSDHDFLVDVDGPDYFPPMCRPLGEMLKKRDACGHRVTNLDLDFGEISTSEYFYLLRFVDGLCTH
ncbi:unnamed protein product [Peniophora sp. CBMAI 1063]|nr:unnamed protein product [Peniophora sp. CBMAI 1063]